MHRTERLRARAARHQDGSRVPVSAFVVGLRPGTTRRRPNGPRLPCRAWSRRGFPLLDLGQELPPGHRWAPAHFLLAPRSHALAFESPGRLGQAPRTTPAARPLPRLVTVFAHSVTLVEGLSLRSSSYVPGSRPAIVSARLRGGAAISAYETRSSAYPSTTTLPDSAPSPSELTDKPLRAFHG